MILYYREQGFEVPVEYEVFAKRMGLYDGAELGTREFGLVRDMFSFVICYKGNRLRIPYEHVSRVEEELGVKDGVEITKTQFRKGIELLNRIRFERGELPNQQGLLAM